MSSVGALKRNLKNDDFAFNVARGLVPNVSLFDKFGNLSVITTAPSDVWASGGTYQGQPLSTVTPETISVFSSSANDTNTAGTGARTLRVIGLNSSWVEQTVDFNLNGVTPVVSAGTWRRVYRAYVLTAGTTGANEGIITIRYTTTTSTLFGIIPIGTNQTTLGSYTVPEGKSLFIKNVRIAIARTNGSAGSAVVSLRAREENSVFRARRYQTLTTSFPFEEDDAAGLVFPARTDIKVRCESFSDANTGISCLYEGYLYTP